MDMDFSWENNSPVGNFLRINDEEHFLFTHVFKLLSEDLFAFREFSDVQLIIGDKCFYVHKIILASQSPFFRTLFSNNRSTTVPLNESPLTSKVMEDVLEFMYFQKVVITPENAYDLCVASGVLQLNNLLKATEHYLNNHISNSNVISLFKLSNELDLEWLKMSSKDFIRENMKDLFKDNSLEELSCKEIIAICKEIQGQDLEDQAPSIRCFFGLIIDWIENDKEDRYEVLKHLMLKLNFDRMGFGSLVKRFATNHLIIETKSFSKCLLELLPQQIKFYEQKLCPINQRKLVSFNFENDEDAKSIQIIDLNCNKSEIYHNIFPQVSHSGFVSLRSKIYFAGGKDEHGKASKELKMFDCIKMKWKNLEAMPQARYDCAVAFLDDYLYVTGGIDEEGIELSSVVRYCLTTGSWSNVAPMLEPRSKHQLVESDNYLHAIGGKTKNIEKFTANKNRWKVVCEFEDIPSWTSAATWYNEALIGINGKIMIIHDEQLSIYETRLKEIESLTDVPPRSRVVTFYAPIYVIFENGSVGEYDYYGTDSEIISHDIKVKRNFTVLCEY